MPVRRGGEAEQCTGRCFIGGGQPGEGGSEALLRGESKQAAGCGGGQLSWRGRDWGLGRVPSLKSRQVAAGGAVHAPRGRRVGVTRLGPGAAQRLLGHGGPLCTRLLED